MGASFQKAQGDQGVAGCSTAQTPVYTLLSTDQQSPDYLTAQKQQGEAIVLRFLFLPHEFLICHVNAELMPNLY